MKRFFLLSFLIAACTAVIPQVHPSAPEEDSLYRLFEQFPLRYSVEEKQELNSLILGYMESVLIKPGSFSYRFDSLRKKVGILDSGDGLFRIFTWNVPLSAWEHEYYGMLQVLTRGEDSCRVYLLRDRLGEIPDLTRTRTDTEHWPGALYYQLIRKKYRKEVFYTLMGYNFNDRWSDKKIIEVLYFDTALTPMFGKPVFRSPEGLLHRVVFEYSGDVAMNLRYNQDMKMIVYDHLAPIEPELKGHPRFYAPDFSYDGYRFKRGKWEHMSDIDVRNR